MNTYTSSSLYSPKHRNTIGSFPSCAQRKPRFIIAGVSERRKKKHSSLSPEYYCHTLLSSGTFRRIRKYLPLALLPPFLSSQSFILWFNTFYVVSDWKFRSYIPYPKPLTKGFSVSTLITLPEIPAFSIIPSLNIFSFKTPHFVEISYDLSWGWRFSETALSIARFWKVLSTFFFNWLPIHLHAHASLSLRATEVKGHCRSLLRYDEGVRNHVIYLVSLETL